MPNNTLEEKPIVVIESKLQDLQQVFQDCFLNSHNTILEGGAAEPLYRPANEHQPHHLITFTHDYYASALHEIAHWLVAGENRRLQEDYGYWYAPDGRTIEQQLKFEQLEVKPQALEWMLSQAAGFGFRVSADNLQAGMGASDEFKAKIFAQVQQWCGTGLNPRSRQLIAALTEFYCSGDALDPNRYCLAAL